MAIKEILERVVNGYTNKELSELINNTSNGATPSQSHIDYINDVAHGIIEADFIVGRNQKGKLEFASKEVNSIDLEEIRQN